MSTRAIIAKPDGDGWKGRYHHSDGYPTGLGLTLITAKDWFFRGNLASMIQHLIDAEPLGWSTINVLNPSNPPAWCNGLTHKPPCTGESHNHTHPQSYTARGEEAQPGGNWVSDKDATESWCDWAYVLREEGIEVIAIRYYFSDESPHKREAVSFGIVAWGDVDGMSAKEPLRYPAENA